MKAVVPYIKAFAILMAAFWGFALAACLLPDAPVQRHVAYSVTHGDLQIDYPRAIIPREECRMDNFTDALILNQAYMCSRDSLLVSSLANYHSCVGGDAVEVLQNLVAGEDKIKDAYSRYWHGSTYLARCLLVFKDYTAIRYILYFLSSLLLLAAAAVVWRRAGWRPVVAAAVGLLAVRVFVMQFSLQFLPVMAIGVATAAYLCVGPRHRRMSDGMVFFVAGALTAYFDLLTAPMLALGLPLCVAAWLTPDGEGFGRGLWRLVRMALLWFAAYLFAWAFKWLLATLLLPGNVFADAIQQISMRTSDIDDWTRLDALGANLKMLPWSYIIISLAVFIVLAVRRFDSRGWTRAALLLVVMLLPYAWYFAAANHSYLHWWFTYRAQGVSVCALLLAVAALIGPRKAKIEK